MASNPVVLSRRIGALGDALWKTQIARVDADGEAVPFADSGVPTWSLLYFFGGRVGSGSILLLLVLFPLLMIIDSCHFIIRLILWPLAATLWLMERRLAMWQDRNYFCPLCHNLMYEPLVYCRNPRCRRVQSRLCPSLNQIFSRTCPGCRRCTWRLLGQRFLTHPEHLLCRDTDSMAGCYHPLTIKTLAGTGSMRNFAIIGTTVPAKHSVMAYVFRHLTVRKPRARLYQPGWEVSSLELDLCDAILHRGLYQDTSRFEHPGNHYTLCRTFVLQAARGKKLLIFHNVLNRWFNDTSKLAQMRLSWGLIRGVVFAVELQKTSYDFRSVTAVEVYSRFVRVVEEYFGLKPSEPLPFKVAVALALPEDSATLTSTDAAKALHENAPALYSLLERTVSKKRLRFFGGPIPVEMDLATTLWCNAAFQWLDA